MAFGSLFLKAKQIHMKLMQLHLFFNTRTCRYFIDWRRKVFLWNCLGIKSQHYLIWLDYLSSCITQKLQAHYTVSSCLRYLFVCVYVRVGINSLMYFDLLINTTINWDKETFVDELELRTPYCQKRNQWNCCFDFELQKMISLGKSRNNSRFFVQ